MIYTNKSYVAIERDMSFGSIHGIALGERGRGRIETFMLVPPSMEELTTGHHASISVELTQARRPYLVEVGDDRLHMLLSSQRGYTRKGCGVIMTPANQDNRILARGKGADGAAGRIGSWESVLTEAKEGDVFRVVWSGYRYGYPATFYVVKGGRVFTADQPDVENLYISLGITPNFELFSVEGGLVINQAEWQVL